MTVTAVTGNGWIGWPRLDQEDTTVNLGYMSVRQGTAKSSEVPRNEYFHMAMDGGPDERTGDTIVEVRQGTTREEDEQMPSQPGAGHALT